MSPWNRPTPVLLLVVLLTVGACGDDYDARGERVPVPPELQGRWVTDHPRYADRFFEVTDERLIFGTGGETLTVETILAVFAREGEMRTLYEFRYRSGAPEVYEFDVLYDPEERTVRLENQPDVVWVPDGEGGSGRSPGSAEG